ncbi:flagellar basal body-associated FliL family protein [bacterium]|nr:flagellar basal body-associated FliL family protein [bacterium]
MAAPEPKESEQVQANKGSKMLTIIVIFNMLLIIGLAIYIIFLKKEPEAKIITEDGKMISKQQHEEEDENSKNEVGELYEMRGIVVNLNEPGGTRMLKVSLTLEYKAEKLKEALKKRDAQLRSEIIIYLSGLTYAQTIGVSQKENILKVLKKKINDVLIEGKVRNIYFNEFVVQ